MMRKGIYTKVGYDKFLNAVKRAYRDSHNVVSRFREVAGRKVIRGRAHCVAGVIEDLLAQFLKGAIPKRCGDLVFFVDQPIIIDHARQPRYPDLLICRQINNGYRLLYGAELKANIGWHHGRLHEIVDEAFTLLGQIRGAKKISGKLYDQRDKHCVFKVGNKFKYDVIIAVAPEGRGRELENVKETWEHGHGQRTRVIALCEGEANEWYDKDAPARARYDMFDMLLSRVRKCIA